MLRMRFMPCDFHPILLVLGNAADLARFADLLAGFARTGDAIDLERSGVFSEDTTVRLVEETTPPGLWRDGTSGRRLIWRLTRDQATEFAREVSKIADGHTLAGSATLECEVLNEIRIKVSLGEFEDEFLLGNAC
ncbi:hypothetical protein [Roseobacter sp. N2S]|jgi:hypothetical protein|uniref:hypothetical protein n=1 Tax=Roseobacter sp. N2S TaxID=2663844 RepID=UPI000DF23321|nr:hypothetical protein [Roseobacter sp. N2S]MDR6267475.1 hypothetical protein [Roseobacter sp. N2S]